VDAAYGQTTKRTIKRGRKGRREGDKEGTGGKTDLGCELVGGEGEGAGRGGAGDDDGLLGVKEALEGRKGGREGGRDGGREGRKEGRRGEFLWCPESAPCPQGMEEKERTRKEIKGRKESREEKKAGREGGREGGKEGEGGSAYFAVCHELGQVDDVRGRQLVRLVGRRVDDAKGLQVLWKGGREGGKSGWRTRRSRRGEGGREGGRAGEEALP